MAAVAGAVFLVPVPQLKDIMTKLKLPPNNVTPSKVAIRWAKSQAVSMAIPLNGDEFTKPIGQSLAITPM